MTPQANGRRVRAATTERFIEIADRCIQHIRGHKAILQLQPELADLAAKHGQPELVQDLPYLLTRPGFMRRTPHLLLIYAGRRRTGARTDLSGALLLHEFRPMGAPTGVFAVPERSGREVVFGAADHRLQLALLGSRYLVRDGARMVMLTVQSAGTDQDALRILGECSSPHMDWAIRTRPHVSYLPLEDTLDETYARMGQKTRSNLRYYRRRAEQELQCRFLPEAEITVQDLAALNARSKFPKPASTLHWRIDVQRQFQQPFLMGLQDGDGNWISLVGGRRFGSSTEILWQMNRDDLPRQSMVSAMRSYMLEHEIAHGATRLYVEGGTPHSMQNSFQEEQVTDLICIRPRLKQAVRQFSKRHVPAENALAGMLRDPRTVWHSC